MVSCVFADGLGGTFQLGVAERQAAAGAPGGGLTGTPFVLGYPEAHRLFGDSELGAGGGLATWVFADGVRGLFELGVAEPPAARKLLAAAALVFRDPIQHGGRVETQVRGGCCRTA